MSDRVPGPDAFGFLEFCDWLDALREDRSTRELLRVILGEPRGANLERALGRAHRVAACMTEAEQVDPREIDTDRRAEIAEQAAVDPSDVDELFVRFEAAASLIEDSSEVRRMVYRRSRPEAVAATDNATQFSTAEDDATLVNLRACLERDLTLWHFVTDQDILTEIG